MNPDCTPNSPRIPKRGKNHKVHISPDLLVYNVDWALFGVEHSSLVQIVMTVVGGGLRKNEPLPGTTDDVLLQGGGEIPTFSWNDEGGKGNFRFIHAPLGPYSRLCTTGLSALVPGSAMYLPGVFCPASCWGSPCFFFVTNAFLYCTQITTDYLHIFIYMHSRSIANYHDHNHVHQYHAPISSQVLLRAF